MGWNSLSQIGFGAGLALQTEFRAARTSQKAYVRLLSIRFQGWLRALISAAVCRTSFPSSPIMPGANTYFTLGLTLGNMGLDELPLRVKKRKVFFGGEEIDAVKFLKIRTMVREKRAAYLMVKPNPSPGLKLRIQAMALVISCLTLASCSTYKLTPESLRSQIAGAVPAEGTFVFTTAGLFLFRKMMNNGIRTLVVTDKNGNEKRLKVDHRTQIRIHKTDGDYSTFYFDTLYFHNDAVIGQRTHFFPSEIKPIPFTEIVKIELQ